MSNFDGSISSSYKKPRQAFRMVRSTFQPPQQTMASYQNISETKTNCKSISMKGAKFSKNNLDDQIQAPSSFMPIPSIDLSNETFHANIQFIKSIRPIKDEIIFQEGDCFPLQTDNRWIILSGQIKIIGINGISFNQTTGFIFFSSPETKKRIKQVIALSSCRACRLPQQFFRDYIRNYLYVKNAEKIKYMKLSPFLIWNQSIAEDLAICMDLIDDLQKDAEIYTAGKQAQHLYFVKQGIVLLQRLGKAGNSVIQNYEKNYENTQLNDEQGLLIVRKGMIFGVDGILIKQKNDQINLLNHDNQLDYHYSEPNPQNVRPYAQKRLKTERNKLKTARIYTAKAIGKCQLYRLDKIVLQTYFKMSQYLNQHPQQLHMSQKQLDRICSQYTDLIMGSNKINKVVRKKQFVFDYKADENAIKELQKKRKKAKQIKEHEKKLKKISKNNNQKQHYEQETYKQIDQYQQLIKKTPLYRKKKSRSPNKQQNEFKKEVSLPSLKKMNIYNKKVQGMIMKKLQEKQLQNYLTYKQKVQKSLLLQENKKQQKPAKKIQNLHCIKVKSYRSIISSLS